MADLVIIGEDWNGPATSSHHLIRNLLPSHRVIWVNTSPNLKGLYQSRKQILTSFAQQEPLPKKSPLLSPTLLNPMLIPFQGQSFARKINKQILLKCINQACQEQGFNDFILWAATPAALDVVGLTGEIASIYHRGLSPGCLEKITPCQVSTAEQQLAEKADLKLFASTALAKKFPGENTIILPQGIDYPRFSTPQPSPIPMDSQRPSVGYYGELSNCLDIEMLSQTATALPAWQFVFAGPVKTNTGVLQELPNVQLIDPVPYSKLPGYLQHWDVVMLPFRQDPEVEAFQELMLKECLASGTLVASTSFPGAPPYAKYIAIQSRNESFSRVIQRAYENNTDKSIRQQLVINESWEHKAEQLEKLIEHLANKVSAEIS